jgi:hypothetical protein
MIYVSLSLLSIVFIELFIRFDMDGSIRSILRISRDALAIITSRDLDDDTKEKVVRRSSLDIFRATLLFLAKFALICMAIYTLFLLLSYLFALSEERVIAASFLPATIVALVIAGSLYIWLRSVIVRRLQSR